MSARIWANDHKREAWARALLARLLHAVGQRCTDAGDRVKRCDWCGRNPLTGAPCTTGYVPGKDYLAPMHAPRRFR